MIYMTIHNIINFKLNTARGVGITVADLRQQQPTKETHAEIDDYLTLKKANHHCN